MKIEHNQPETQSKDLTTENIEQLKKLFPNIVEEGKVNFDVLRQLLGEEVVSEQEYYRFTWPGKHQARQEALKRSTGTLRPAKDESVDWDKTENLYIEGDNLEVLKLLQKSYFNKVKMIYIDPPYNTGKDFVYKDNYKDNLAEYNEKFNRTDAEGNVLSSETNNEGNARYHSNWLNMMYPRLQLARTLLKDDGVIFISIDDNEVHNLRRICDEIFGEENFRNEILIKKGVKSVQEQFDTWDSLGKAYESILFYTKNSNYRFPKQYEILEDTKPSSWNNHWRGTDRPTMRYELLGITPSNGQWRWNKQRSEIAIKNYNYLIERIKEDNNQITEENIDKYYEKLFFNHEDLLRLSKHGKPEHYIQPRNKVLLNNLFFSYGISSSQEVSKLFEEKIFDNPKSSKIIKRLIDFFDEEDIILDFFAGSSTTAHAVMDLNKGDLLEGKSGNRKYIMVQLPEPTDEKSEAYKAGYKNISEIGKERIRRAANQIKEELKDQPEVLEQLDLGFKVFKLDSSNIHTWDTAPEALENNLFRDEVIKEDRTAEDVLYEVLLKYGLDLTYPIEEVTLDNKKVYSVGAGQLIFCLDDGVTRNSAQAIIDWAKEDEIIDPKVVFKDAGFTSDVEKTNIIQLFKTHGVMDVKSI